MNFDKYHSRQKQMTIDGLKMGCVDEGHGPALLLIQGNPDWGYLWKDCLEPLAAHFRAIIPNLAVYGYSDHRDCLSRSIKVQARILAGLLYELRIEEEGLSAFEY